MKVVFGGCAPLTPAATRHKSKAMQGRADFRIVKTRIDRRFARIVESCRIAKSDNSITSILRFWAGLRGPIFGNSLGHFMRRGAGSFADWLGRQDRTPAAGRPQKTKTQQVRLHSRGDWLGRQDSNLRMPVPKTGALPLGDAPASRRISRGRRAYSRQAACWKWEFEGRAPICRS